MSVHNEPNLVSVPQALKVLPVAKESLYRRLKSGELPCYKFGRKVLVDVKEIQDAMRVKK
ncbi:MAG: hypothetical protein NPIRA02_40210 [Nitrospirales bacterium]|nr:MAG: hypothetical protein NPIRA02_40210 [Nitrospirales bacterium]